MESEKSGVGCVECEVGIGVLSVKCEVWGGKCKVWSVKCTV